MSGILEIRENVTWMPAQWVFDQVLERISDELKMIEPDLSTTLVESKAESGIGYCNLSNLNSKKFCNLVKAVESAYEKSEKEGPASFYNPDYYQPFMSLFAELKSLLLNDIRSQSL